MADCRCQRVTPSIALARFYGPSLGPLLATSTKICRRKQSKRALESIAIKIDSYMYE